MFDEALRALGIGPDEVARVVAIGWATVELDRAAREFGADDDFLAADGSIHLGAGCRVRPGGPARPALVLLEPSTEGRLAASLARHGEGWTAVWLAVAGGHPGVPVSVPRPGPLGIERLRLDGPRDGPHRLLVEAATIAVS